MDLRKTGWGECGMDLVSSESGLVACACERVDESSGFGVTELVNAFSLTIGSFVKPGHCAYLTMCPCTEQVRKHRIHINKTSGASLTILVFNAMID
jgi:hypothetical protein